MKFSIFKAIGSVLAISLALILLANLLIPSAGGNKPNPILWKIEIDARVTAYNILNYSLQVKHYPSSLEKIRINHGKEDVKYFLDPESKREYEWIYFGASMPLWENPHQKILIASPTKFTHKGEVPTDPSDNLRVVAFADGHSEVIDESEYQKLITQPVE